MEGLSFFKVCDCNAIFHSLSLLIFCYITSSAEAFDAYVHCKMKPGCSPAPQCDPVPKWWNEKEYEIEENLLKKEFPITCLNDGYNELRNELSNFRKVTSQDIGDMKAEIANLKIKNEELEEAKEQHAQEIVDMKVEITNLKTENSDLLELINATKENQVQIKKTVLKPKDCASVDEESAKSWNGNGGVFDIYPTTSDSIEVYCDTATDGGGWIVFQRRVDGSVNFYRNWADYVAGFGDINNNYWMGLEKIHQLTSRGIYELRIDMTNYDGVKKFAKYESFSVGGAASRYRLNIGSYSGTAGDGLTYHNGRIFYTKDSDSSGLCAGVYKGGWWYNKCYHANLNGVHGVRKNPGGDKGITWKNLGINKWIPQRWVEMKFRPAT